MTVAVATAPFLSVTEQQDRFLALFPHRFDYLYANVPALGEATQWQTERRYPLADRAIQQGSLLYGVRFGRETNYCLLDIDINSPYHPNQNEQAIAHLIAALEPLGLINHITCTSSTSGGLHLYFPFEQPQVSWQLAAVVSQLLTQAGFQLKPGQLELFPNPRPYIAGTPSLFNGHRLPLQQGSYLLDASWQFHSQSQQAFAQQWAFAQNRNVLDPKFFKSVLIQTKRQTCKISGRADQFLSDLETEIAQGWTEFGQTNRLLGRIAMRCYVFHHILHRCSPLTGQDLVNEIIRVAIASPGYTIWCQHQHEIEKKAEEWARCVENSHYFPYGTANGKYKEKVDQSQSQEISWNEKQSLNTREKIKGAIALLLNQSALPAQTTARFKALTQQGISGSSLYRHKDLWHPEYLIQEDQINQSEEAIEAEEPKQSNSNQSNITSLLSSLGCNVLLLLASRCSGFQNFDSEGCNARSRFWFFSTG
jgi:hypothetical protein